MALIHWILAAVSHWIPAFTGTAAKNGRFVFPTMPVSKRKKRPDPGIEPFA
jgi:hypothetical protein